MQTRAEWVVDQGLEGMHHLFEPYVVRQAMTISGPSGSTLEAPMARQVEALVERLEGERSISRQRDQIADAPPEVQRVLVRLYFEMLFRVLEERSETFH
jgi:hypothetical protein